MLSLLDYTFIYTAPKGAVDLSTPLEGVGFLCDLCKVLEITVLNLALYGFQGSS